MSEGAVYFLQVGTDGPIKIGYTKSRVDHRLRAMQTISPHVLRWIGYFPGSRGDERNAHKLLQNSSLRSEWFYPTVEVLAFVHDKSPGFSPVTIENGLFQARRRKGQVSKWDVPTPPHRRDS